MLKPLISEIIMNISASHLIKIVSQNIMYICKVELIRLNTKSVALFHS